MSKEYIKKIKVDQEAIKLAEKYFNDINGGGVQTIALIMKKDVSIESNRQLSKSCFYMLFKKKKRKLAFLGLVILLTIKSN